QSALARGDDAASWLYTGASVLGGVGDIATAFVGNYGALARAGGVLAGGVKTAVQLPKIPYYTTLGISSGQYLIDALEGRSFNERTGQYQELDWTQRAALVGAAGIDLVQVGRPTAFVRSMFPGAKA